MVAFSFAGPPFPFSILSTLIWLSIYIVIYLIEGDSATIPRFLSHLPNELPKKESEKRKLHDKNLQASIYF